jgi:hypothetical protein
VVSAATKCILDVQGEKGRCWGREKKLWYMYIYALNGRVTICILLNCVHNSRCSNLCCEKPKINKQVFWFETVVQETRE